MSIDNGFYNFENGNFDKLAQILPHLSFDGDIAGGALSIFKNGQCVLDTAFGYANDKDKWTTHTLSVNYSIGKGVLASLIAVMVSQGLLDYQRPISHDWAEFGINGKQAIRLIDVLTHQAGLYNINSIIDNNDSVGDYQAMIERVATMGISTPVSQNKHHYVSSYSALVSGWILGGLIQKVTQLPLQTALDHYLAQPLGVSGELIFGLDLNKQKHIAKPQRVWHGNDAPKKPTLKPDSDHTKQFLDSLPLWENLPQKSTQAINKLYFDPNAMNLINYKNALLADNKTPINYHNPTLLATPIPAANGVSTSHALAVLYAMHANNGIWQDQTLINQSTLTQMRTIYNQGLDAVMPASMNWRAGFHKLFSVNDRPDAYGHMGYNGSVAFCDPRSGLSLAFIHNFDSTLLNDIRQFIVSELALMIDERL